MSRAGARVVALLVLAMAGALGGCASQSKVVADSPELAIASALAQFRIRAERFAADRRAINRDRQAIRQRAEDDAARSRIEAIRRVSVWRIAGDKEVLELYQHIVDATREGGEVVEALERQQEEHRAALATTDTKVVVRGDKLTAAGKALAALADQRAPMALVKAYLAFLVKADAELDKLQHPEPEAPGDRPPPR
jgi:hypothetical protein